jgi:hypothetical protein
MVGSTLSPEEGNRATTRGAAHVADDAHKAMEKAKTKSKGDLFIGLSKGLGLAGKSGEKLRGN